MTGALSSWSRRRAAVAEEAAAERAAAEEAVVARQQAELCEKTDEEILAELGLPDPASLVKGDDFKAFMAKAVPQHLRKRALRSLWRSDPVLACLDGLNDYDDDYLAGSFGQGPISTTYQVGKGLMAHVLEVERLANQIAGEEPQPAEAQESDTDSVPAEEAQIARSDVTPPEQTSQPVETASAEAPAQPAPRRMRFHFEEGQTA